MHYENDLRTLYGKLEVEYDLYCKGVISEREYCLRVRPVDAAIAKNEMATLRGISVLPISFVQKFLKPVR